MRPTLIKRYKIEWIKYKIGLLRLRWELVVSLHIENQSRCIKRRFV